MSELGSSSSPSDAGRGENEQGQGGGKDPATLKITFVTKQGRPCSTGDKLLAIPREDIPGTAVAPGLGAGHDPHRRRHQDVQEALRQGLRWLALNLDRRRTISTSTIPFVKLNRQGALRVRIYKKAGTEWQPGGGDLRDLSGIGVLE